MAQTPSDSSSDAPSEPSKGGDTPLTSYRRGVLRPRADLYGRITGWLGAHPFLGGLIGGLTVVGIAAASAWEGVTTVPSVAAILSAIVILTWVVLFYFLRSFFAGQAVREAYERYVFSYDEEGALLWERDGEEVARVRAPRFEIYAEPGMEAANPGQRDPWTVWLKVAGENDDQMIVETRVTAGEAGAYSAADEAMMEGTDEELPIGVASALLQEADRRV